MNIAIFGATSQIAKDLIVSFANNTDYHCILFSRRTTAVQEWCQSIDLKSSYKVQDYADFSHSEMYDVIINFVGVGDPALAKKMGAGIFDVTYTYDLMVLDYLENNPKMKYLFLSSGAAFGGEFSEPIDCHSQASFPINNFKETDWYGIAKLYAEARHRALSDLFIVDIRVFNYFSHTQDINARFLITDMVRAIRDKEVFKTSSENIVRDFITPIDFYNLIKSIIEVNDKLNLSLDCYTRAPVDKLTLLKVLKARFCLEYDLEDAFIGLNATGSKINYYSTNNTASELGYKPIFSSIQGIVSQIEKMDLM